MGGNADTLLLQHLQSKTACKAERSGEPPGELSAAPKIAALAEFEVRGEVGMGRAWGAA